MMMKKLIASLLMIFTVACGAAVFAQKPEPFTVGEDLTYEGKYSKAILRGIPGADLNFSVERAPDSQDFLIKSEVKSKGTLVKLFFKFNLNIQSIADAKNYSVKRTIKRDEQGSRVRESEALFDHAAKKVIYVETDPNNAARPPRQIASPINKDTQDLITAVYMLRRLPLAVGKTFELSVSDSGLVYKIPVRVTARQQQKSILGRVWCFRLEPEVFGANRLIDGKGSMIIWITDDARRLPVRSQINSSIGRVEVKLKRAENKSASQTKTD
jgi:hypothetical protein